MWVLDVVSVVEDVAKGFGGAQYVAHLNGGVVYPFGVAFKEERADERFVEGHSLRRESINHLNLVDES